MQALCLFDTLMSLMMAELSEMPFEGKLVLAQRTLLIIPIQ